MQVTSIIRIIGMFLMIFSLTMVPPTLLALHYNDGALYAFIITFFISLIAGFMVWFPFRKAIYDLKTRDGFLIVVLFWAVLSIFGAIPFALAPVPHLSFTNAVFESMSGLTTTGATILPGIDYLPHAIKYYHQQLQFLGGMGIIVLAVAILPMLGIGGLQLYRAEIPGPAKDTKLTPRITQTAKALWYIYVGLTLLCVLAYWLSGMDFFDAVGESFGTISTGGFSMHDDSFAHYHSSLINSFAIVFMICGSTNFSLHFLALQQRSFKSYWSDSEFQTYIFFLLSSAIITTVMLIAYQVYSDPKVAIFKAFFNAISIGTNTGFLTAPFQSWPSFVPLMLIFAGMIGGCAASTSGGIKIIRILLLYKQGIREIKRLIHPRGMYPLKLGERILPENVAQAVWGYIAVFSTVFILLLITLMGMGLNFESSFGAIVACFTNLGLGIGSVADNFVSLDSATKWVLIITMLGGRLEIFTLLILLTPDFWRK